MVGSFRIALRGWGAPRWRHHHGGGGRGSTQARRATSDASASRAPQVCVGGGGGRGGGQRLCRAAPVPPPLRRLQVGANAVLKAGLISGSLSLLGDVLAQLATQRPQQQQVGRERNRQCRRRGGAVADSVRAPMQANVSSYDVARAARMGSFGLCFYGPYQVRGAWGGVRRALGGGVGMRGPHKASTRCRRLCNKRYAQHYWYRALDARFPGRALGNFVAKVALNQLCLAPIVIAGVFAWNLALQGQLAQWPRKAEADFVPTLLNGWKFWVPAASVNFTLVPLQHQVRWGGRACKNSGARGPRWWRACARAPPAPCVPHPRRCFT